MKQNEEEAKKKAWKEFHHKDCEIDCDDNFTTLENTNFSQFKKEGAGKCTKNKEGEEADEGLQSVVTLIRKIKNRNEPRFNDILKRHTFIGWVTRKFAVIQDNTALFKVNMQNVTEHLFYQLTLEGFGKFKPINLNPPPVILELAGFALDDVEESGWTEADGDKARLARYVSDLLREKSEMLSEYFSMKVTPDGRLRSIPKLLEGYIPFLGGLPNLLLRFATEVDWDEEEKCFDNLAREFGRFYSIKDDKESRYDTEQHSNDIIVNPGESDDQWTKIFSEAVLPLLREKVLLPKECAKDFTVIPIANLAGKEYEEVVTRC